MSEEILTESQLVEDIQLDAIDATTEDASAEPSKVGRAAELISAVSSDIAELARTQELNRAQLEDLSKQISYIRQLLDYCLFVTPQHVNSEEELYPITAWIRDQFQNISRKIQQINHSTLGTQEFELEAVRLIESTLSGDAGPSPDKSEDKSKSVAVADHGPSETARLIEQTITSEMDALEKHLRGNFEALNIRFSELVQLVAGVEAQQQAESAGGIVATWLPEREVAPHDDIDIRFDEMRSFIEERTSHWRLYENFFYGLVLLLLLGNMALLCWLNFTG